LLSYDHSTIAVVIVDHSARFVLTHLARVARNFALSRVRRLLAVPFLASLRFPFVPPCCRSGVAVFDSEPPEKNENYNDHSTQPAHHVNKFYSLDSQWFTSPNKTFSFVIARRARACVRVSTTRNARVRGIVARPACVASR
jgi:hypothetical protein